MKSRPRSLTILAISYLVIAFSLPIQVALLYQHRLNEVLPILSKLTDINFLVIGGLLLAAYFAFRASKFLYFLIPPLLLLVAINNYVVASYGFDFSLLATMSASAGFFMLNCIALEPTAMKVLKNQNLRWWNRAPRVQLNLPIRVLSMDGDLLEASIFDLSHSGSFLELSSENLSKYKLEQGNTLEIRMQLPQGRCVEGHAKLVRKATESIGAYPPGVGLKFQDFSFYDKYLVHKAVHNQI